MRRRAVAASPVEQAAANQLYLDHANVAGVDRLGRTRTAAANLASMATKEQDQITHTLESTGGIMMRSVEALGQINEVVRRMERRLATVEGQIPSNRTSYTSGVK